MKIYRKDKHTLHNVVYVMVVLLTIAIVATWIYKGVFPIQAIVGYGIVLGYAAMLKGNQTYVEMDEEGFRVINIKDSKYNKSFNLEILESRFAEVHPTISEINLHTISVIDTFTSKLALHGF